MLNGCQKKIYHVRNVGSRFFDEAYLVLRDDCQIDTRTPAKDLATEADRIIRDASAELRVKRQRITGGVKTAAAFALGAVSSSVVIGTLVLIFFGG